VLRKNSLISLISSRTSASCRTLHVSVGPSNSVLHFHFVLKLSAPSNIFSCSKAVAWPFHRETSPLNLGAFLNICFKPISSPHSRKLSSSVCCCNNARILLFFFLQEFKGFEPLKIDAQFHVLISSLKRFAPSNIPKAVSTFETSQKPIGWLNFSAFRKNLERSITFRRSQNAMLSSNSVVS